MPKSSIGQAELEILLYIQDHHPVTVRQVAEHVSRTKGHVRTTVLNVMARLVRKRYLVRRKQEGVYVYSDRKSTCLNSSHANISYAVFCLKKKKQQSV